MTELGTAMMLGMVTGFFLGVTVAGRQRQAIRRDLDPDWRRSFNHENTNPPSGPPPLILRSKPTRELLFFGAPVRAADDLLDNYIYQRRSSVPHIALHAMTDHANDCARGQSHEQELTIQADGGSSGAMTSTTEIKVGQLWRTRGRMLATITEIDGDSGCCVCSDLYGEHWHGRDGRSCLGNGLDDCEDDLVELLQDSEQELAAPSAQQRAIAACATALAAGRLTPDEAGLIRSALEAKQ